MRGRDDGWMNWATEVARAEVRARARSGSYAHTDDGVVDELSEVERENIGGGSIQATWASPRDRINTSLSPS